MYYAVIQRPEIDTSTVELINKQYDPTYRLVGPHVTLVFPVSGTDVNEEKLREHVGAVVRTVSPFLVHLVELELSWDQWLFLTPNEGKQEFTKLHDELYTGMLSPFLRTDIPFSPHVALGQFAARGSNYSLKNPEAVPLDHTRYEKAREEIEKLRLNYTYTATVLELIKLDDDFTQSETIEKYKLGL